uniref:phospholipase B-like 1 n=1 Tax=Styela clava TaxID=7725 RepID=UPI00193A3E94|nr:phospholipase B-like 1 [Styela clava]XP_039262473.1 phospholipase B-like 1 [Styela clava]
MQVFKIIFFIIISTSLKSICLAEEGSIVLSDGVFIYKREIVKEALAYGQYNDEIAEKGWGILDITATTHNMKYSPDQIMYAAGMLEGALTSKRIYQNYENLKGFLFDNRPADIYNRSCDFFAKQEKWLKENVISGKGDIRWEAVGYMQSQLEGLLAGYTLTANNSMSMCQMHLLNGAGDMLDLFNVFHRPSHNHFKRMSKKQLRQYNQKHGHCSVLIKVTPGFENMYMGHSTWFVYSAMLRIYKNYDFQVFGKEHKNSKMSFSSYPGFLQSWDDFYILGSEMVILQTTNNIYNTSLYDLVTPKSLLAWHRVRAANLLASNGYDWGEIIKFHNSGTYNNQYMVVDLKKFTPEIGFEDGALYVVEQIPGFVESHDQTNILREGYWASYNVPFYESIYNMSGYPAVTKNDPDLSHDLAPRAKIFRRDQGTVVDMESMKKILRYNNYKFDKYSEGDACNAICCRNDSNYMGCTDSKATDYFLAKSFTTHAINGPTVGGLSDIPPYKWPQNSSYHEGMPNVWNFTFIDIKPKYFG